MEAAGLLGSDATEDVDPEPDDAGDLLGNDTPETGIHGVSGRAMMEALIAGKRDPHTLAKLAGARARVKHQPPAGGAARVLHRPPRDHAADDAGQHDRIGAQIAELDREIEAAIAPFSPQAAQLCDMTGVDRVAAAELIGEIGVDMSRFLDPAASGVVGQVLPQTHESAGRSKQKGRGKGNPWIAGTVGRIVFGVSRTDTLPRRTLPAAGATSRQTQSDGGHRQQRAHRRLALAGRPRRRVSVISGPAIRIVDQQGGRRARNLATQLQALTGQKITIRDGKAVIVESEAAYFHHPIPHRHNGDPALQARPAG